MLFILLPQPVGLLKLMLSFYFAQVVFKGENTVDGFCEIYVLHHHVSGHL